LKKLVYLYIMNYAKTHPDRVVLAVNTFQIDAADPNPLVRALAIRTMGQIRVEEIAEHLCQPLQKTMKDPDPYVRKTAAICVAKLYDLNPELVETMGFLDSLNGLLADANPMVVANAVAALAEIDDMSDKEVFRVTEQNLSKLQAALNLATEWGQVFILNALSKYVPRSSEQAEQICERVVPRLQHANAAVVLGAVRVMMLYLDKITKPDTVDAFQRKLGPPLVTLLAKEPEIQYVALRNIHLVVQKRPAVLAHELKVFFCKYNDPIYVKMEKLEILIMLANVDVVEQVLMELKEYAAEVDVEFVRKAVRAIGRCAIKIEPAAKRCVGVLLDLIATKVNYVVQEAIIVIRDIFRRYPNTYEAVIANLCENLETLDEPEAKAAMIWIIGEYADRIDNADELLEGFLDNFADEPAAVQLQLLTAVVKLFLKRPKRTQALVKQALDLATEKSDNPDLRDRGFVYWRLLATNPAAAKAVVLAEKPLIKDTTSLYEQPLLDELVANISTLASVYHKPPESFVSKMKGKQKTFKHRQARAEQRDEEEEEAYEDERRRAARRRPPTAICSASAARWRRRRRRRAAPPVAGGGGGRRRDAPADAVARGGVGRRSVGVWRVFARRQRRAGRPASAAQRVGGAAERPRDSVQQERAQAGAGVGAARRAELGAGPDGDHHGAPETLGQRVGAQGRDRCGVQDQRRRVLRRRQVPALGRLRGVGPPRQADLPRAVEGARRRCRAPPPALGLRRAHAGGGHQASRLAQRV
jgi:AP-1 complex subunit beta-1